MERSDISCQSEADHVERITEKQNIHSLSKSVEVTTPEKPASYITPKNSSSPVGCSHPSYLTDTETQDTGCGDDVVVNTDGDASAPKESKVDFLRLRKQKKNKKGDAPSEIAEPQRCPLNDQEHKIRQAADDGSSSPHQDPLISTDKEEKMTYTSILHQMQQQQKRKAGRRFKKKTLMKMAKLLLIAQGWDSESTEMPKVTCSSNSFVESEPSVAQQKEGMVNPVSSQNDLTNETNDCDRETVPLNSSGDVISSSPMTAPKSSYDMNKTSKRKRKSSTSKKQEKVESRERAHTISTNLPDVAVSAQEAPLLPKPVTDTKAKRKSRKMSPGTFKEDSKIESDSSNLSINSPAALSNFDACKTGAPKRKIKTPSDPKDTVSTKKQNLSPQVLADGNNAMPPLPVTEGSLGLGVTQNDDDVACTADEEVPNKYPFGVKSIAEVLKVRRKAGRPFKKKTLRKIAKLLAAVQEGESNNEPKQCDVSTADTPSSQPPSLSQASFKAKTRKKETKMTASATSTPPQRRSTRTRFCSPKLKYAAEYMDIPVHAFTENLLLHSQRCIESVIKSEDSADPSLLDSPNDEELVKTESQDSVIENVMEKIRPPKKNPKFRRNTKADLGLGPPPLDFIPDVKALPPSAEKDPTKTMVEDRKKRVTASESKRCQSTVHSRSTTGISQKQTETCDEVATENSTPTYAASKTKKHAARNKKCKEEPISLPLSCQTELSLSFSDYGVKNQCTLSESSLQTSHIKTEPAWEPLEPQLTNYSKTKKRRRKKKPPVKTKDPVPLKVPIKEESGSFEVGYHTLNQERQVEEETTRTTNPEKLPKGKNRRTRKKAKTMKENIRSEQTVNPDLGEKSEPPGQVSLQQTSFAPVEVKKEPDESLVTTIKTSKARQHRKRKLHRKDSGNAKKPATLTAVCGSVDERECSGHLGSHLADEKINDKATEDKEKAVSSKSSEIPNATCKSLKRIITRKRLKEEPGQAFSGNPLEKNNNVIDKDLKCQDNRKTPLAEAANSGDMKIFKGKSKLLAVRRNLKVAASAEHNTGVASVECGFTHPLLENSSENLKGKRSKQGKAGNQRLASVDSVKGFSKVADNVPDPSKILNEYLAKVVKVKGKRKRKRLKSKLSVVKSVENNIIQTDMVSKPEGNTTASLRSRSKESQEIKIRARERNKSLRDQLAGDAIKKTGKVPATKVATCKNSVTALAETSRGNLKSKGRKKTVTLSENTFEIKHMASDCEKDHTVSTGVDSELPKALTSKDLTKSKVTKRKGKTKCMPVKEELTVTTLVEEEVPDSATNAVKSKRKGKQTLKARPSMKKSENDTVVLAKQETGTKLKTIGQKGKIKTKGKTLTSTRSRKRAMAIKTEDVDTPYESVHADSSSTQIKSLSSVDLNIVQLEQDKSKAVSPAHEEIRPVQFIQSDVPAGKPQAKVVRKRRRNKTGWETTKKKSKHPRASMLVVPPSSSEISGLSSKSSPCNSTSDAEMLNHKMESTTVDPTEHQTTEALCTQINTMETPNKDQVKEMTSSTKLKHFATLKHLITPHEKLKTRKTLECSFCRRSFRHISAFTVHKRLHTGEKPYRCLKCSKSFAQLPKLCSHSNIHQQRQAIPCPCCASKFQNKDELIAHFRTHIKRIKKFSLIDDIAEGKDANNQQKDDCIDSAVISKDRKSLKCPTCPKEFINRATFTMHQQAHSEAKPHTCPVCGKRFCKSSSLNVHEKSHWPVKPYACSVCGEGFVKLQELKRHSQMHSGPTPFFCATCKQAFSSLASLRSHQASQICLEKGDNRDVNGFLVTQSLEGQINTPVYYKCSICRQLYRHWCQYTLHLQTHTNSQPICDICGQQYDRAPEVNTHCKVCCKLSGEERTCSSSLSEIWQELKQPNSPAREPQLDSVSSDGQQVSPDSDQNKHATISFPVEPVDKEMTDMQSPPPPPTGNQSVDGQSVNNDLDISAPSPISGGECPSPASCSLISISSHRSDGHPPRFRPRSLIQSHCGRYSCGKCGKSFNLWKKLWLHQCLHHKKGRPFSCTQCNLEFKFFGLYIDHLQEHAAQRPFACPLCPDTFATSEDITTHISECHKPHDCMKCSTCGKNFSSLSNLKKHSVLHKGASSHFCLPCNLSFHSSSALQTHMKTHRARLKVPQPKGLTEPFSFPYNCKKCKAKFTNADLLEAHQVCHFTEEEDPASSPANIVSCLPTGARDMKGLVSGLSQQKRSLPVSNKKYLFRYPHPDRLYVVPVISSAPPVFISDTEEECQEMDSRSSSIPTSTNSTVPSHFTEEQPGASSDSSGQNISNIPQSSAVSTHVDMDACRSVTETGSTHHSDQDHVTPCSSDKPSVHNVISDCDNNPAEASTVVTTPEQKEALNDIYSCAVCMEKFTDVSKLHEHYLDHARKV